VETIHEWQGLCRVIAEPGLAVSDELSTLEGRRAAHDSIDRTIASWSETRAVDQALAALQAAGVPVEPVTSPCDIDRDEQMRARGFWEELDHPVVGQQRYPGWPMRLSGSRGAWYRSPAPLLGQHTEEVLREALAMTDTELEELREANVIGTALVRK